MHRLLLLTLISFNPVWSSQNGEPSCEAKIIEFVMPSQNRTMIKCENIGADGKSVYESLSTKPLTSKNGRTYQFDQLADTVSILELTASGNVTITANSLAALKKLIILRVESKSPASFDIMSADEFQQMRDFDTLHLSEFRLSDGSIKAISTLKDKVDTLTIKHCSPTQEILRTIEQFSKLKSLEVHGMCRDAFPATSLRKSAPTLTRLNVKCKLPVITSGLLQGMRSLTDLAWTESGITDIEPGAFDDLKKLHTLDLSNNTLRNLPADLFMNNKKLTLVDLRGNIGISQIGRDNFTHVDKIQEFQLNI